MEKIASALTTLLLQRNSSAIPFGEFDNPNSYSSQVYYEYLIQLSEAIVDQLEAFEFHPRIVVKDNIVQIEVYKKDANAPKDTPFATFCFGHVSDMPKNLVDGWATYGNFKCKEAFQKSASIDVEQVHHLFNSLFEIFEKLGDPDTKIHHSIKDLHQNSDKDPHPKKQTFKDWFLANRALV